MLSKLNLSTFYHTHFSGKVLFRSNVREVALKRKGALEDYCKVRRTLFASLTAITCLHHTEFATIRQQRADLVRIAKLTH